MRRRLFTCRRAALALLMLLCMSWRPPRAHAGGTGFRVALAVLAHRADAARRHPPTVRQQAKLRGALGLIGYLGRAYCARRSCRGRRLDRTFRVLRPLLAARRYGLLAARLETLAARYPVPLADLWPRSHRVRWQRGRFLYDHLCAGCHAGARPRGLTPDLFAMARRDGPRLLMIRILAGVRGTRRTALANPLTRAQIGSLALYLTAPAGPPPPAS